jgi:Ca2+-binding EF-hand superfamily protein
MKNIIKLAFVGVAFSMSALVVNADEVAAPSTSAPMPDNQSVQTFQMMDEDKDGNVSGKELHGFMKKHIDPNFRKEDVKSMMDEADQDQDGQLTQKEVTEVMNKK